MIQAGASSSQMAEVVLNISLKSQQSSHVPCVLGGKNFIMGLQTVSYTRQNCWYLIDSKSKEQTVYLELSKSSAVEVRHIFSTPLMEQHAQVAR